MKNFVGLECEVSADECWYLEFSLPANCVGFFFEKTRKLNFFFQFLILEIYKKYFFFENYKKRQKIHLKQYKRNDFFTFWDWSHKILKNFLLKSPNLYGSTVI
jgi:hypothetical protein